MATKTAQRPLQAPVTREGEEIWATTTGGVVWVPVVDARGRENVIRVGDFAGSELRISTIDREVAQSRVRPVGTDPFRNGMLKRIDADQNLVPETASTQAVSTDELTAIFAKNGNAFRSAVGQLNEHNVRRLNDLAEPMDATASQSAFLRELIESYKPKVDEASYRDLTSGRA